MINIILSIFISVLIVSFISVIGIFTLTLGQKKLQNILIYLVSFSAGTLFGDAFIHLLPESAEKMGFGLEISLLVLLGIIIFFIVEKFVHWHHCHDVSTKKHIHPFAYTNLIGDALHNFIDGIIIAASYFVSVPVGVATTIAVIIHEIPQEIGDFGVLLHTGLSKSKALFLNFIVGIVAVLGAFFAIIVRSKIESFSALLIPFAAGGFIYIAGSDLIPELHKEVKISRSLIQLLTFILGIGVMVLFIFLE